MKTYVLMISKNFPATHPRKGEPTNFAKKILKCGVGFCSSKDVDGNVYNIKPLPILLPDDIIPKIHTIRGNYELWKKRVDKINAGEAILSLRQWTGSPYNYARDGSKQVEFLRLERVGIQKVSVGHFNVPQSKHCEKYRRILVYCHKGFVDLGIVATNDGLNERDFIDWFKNDLNNGCVIHFTDFRYA